MQQPHSPNPYLPAYITGTGVKTDSARGGMTLAASTYFVPFGGEGSPITAIHVQWDAAVVGTITVEDSNNPDVTIISTTNGEWLQENPSTAYVPVTGGTVINLTITIPGGTIGGCVINLGNSGMLRSRLKVVLSTGGVMNFTVNGKQ